MKSGGRSLPAQLKPEEERDATLPGIQTPGPTKQGRHSTSADRNDFFLRTLNLEYSTSVDRNNVFLRALNLEELGYFLLTF